MNSATKTSNLVFLSFIGNFISQQHKLCIHFNTKNRAYITIIPSKNNINSITDHMRSK